ncbi:MAG: helix-turn-helix transcriptional regulator [Candidatus Limiplasma sp.]|nr:helix-turn-helix transcriptional regulator [Candidatus Limiplasma sp.]
MDNFSDRLKSLRALVKESQDTVARQIGIPQSTYSAIENGREPEFSLLSKLAQHFHVTIDYLVEGNATVSFQNYGDIVEVIQALLNTGITMSIGLMPKDKEKPDYNPNVSTVNKYIYGQIRFDDDFIIKLLDGWGSTLQLHNNGTIDPELYSLWLQKRKDEYRKIPLSSLSGGDSDVKNQHP